MPADEIFKLSTDLQQSAAKVVRATFDVFKDESIAFRDDWRQNAVATSGKHGKHYPKSITAEMKIGTSITAEIGPESSKPQGRMGRGFEFGSKNQPPHLDGARALPAAEARLEKAAADAIEKLLP